MSAQLNGGNFGNGFVTSLASSYLGGKVRSSTSSIVRIAGASIIGGTASKVTGGKFVSGAATSAISEASGELGEKESGNYDPWCPDAETSLDIDPVKNFDLRGRIWDKRSLQKMDMLGILQYR